MTVRTQPQRWADAAILLALWTKAAKKPLEDAGDRLRLMKLAFLAAHDLHEQRFRALGLTFYRWKWGPLSNEVYEAWEMLTDAGLMEEEERFLITAGDVLAPEAAVEGDGGGVRLGGGVGAPLEAPAPQLAFAARAAACHRSRLAPPARAARAEATSPRAGAPARVSPPAGIRALAQPFAPSPAGGCAPPIRGG